MEALSKTKIICFDKTGTLTKGEFKVEKIYSNNISQEEFLNILCSLESYSNHPIAISISKLEHIKIEFTNIIRGEVSGDAKVNYLDYVNVYNHIQKIKHPELDKKELKNEYLISADMSGDGKVNYLDYVQIYNKIKELKGGN